MNHDAGVNAVCADGAPPPRIGGRVCYVQGMGRITVLDEQLASQIAAGEVVERPASVVKELFENSLDAGAKRIEVVIEGGGTERIVVIDDGEGMDADDAVTCFSRHATSKLHDAGGLLCIGTFGFRGEALAAIASVSKVVLTTRPPASDVAHKVVIDGGHVAEVGEEGTAPGTRIEVRDLFFNVPARKKFLKTPRSEQIAIVDIVKAAALSSPEVTFKLLCDGKKKFESLGVAEGTPLDDPRQLERIVACLGKQVRDVVFPVDVATDRIRVVGFVVAPLETRRDLKGILLSVNGRPVKDKTLVQAVRAAFRPLLQAGRHPQVVLDVQVNLEGVDVNVHPQKAEVRFSEPRKISGHLVRLLTDFLATTPWLSKAPTKTYQLQPWSVSKQAGTSSSASASSFALTSPEAPTPQGTDDNVSRDDDVVEAHRERVRQALAKFGDRGRRAPLRGDLRQQATTPKANSTGATLLHGRWLFAPGDDNAVVVVDADRVRQLHARYKLLDDRASQMARARPLLFPAQLPFAPAEVDVLDDKADLLASFGVDLGRFADDRVLVRGVPACVDGGRVEDMCRALLDVDDDATNVATCVARFPHRSLLDDVNAVLQAYDKLPEHDRDACQHVLDDGQLARWFA